jgi:large subunit ribosomal protein L4
MALTCKARDRQLVVVDNFEMTEIKTKAFVKIIEGLDVEKVLIITREKSPQLDLSSRNVPGVKILQTQGLNVYDILKYPKLVLVQPAIEGIEGRLA